MLYEFFISLRFLTSKKRQKFVSVTAIISILGVTIGVMALNVVLAVMSGFEDELKNKILDVNPHIVVMSYDGPITNYGEVITKIRNIPDILGVNPLIYSQAMLVAEGNVSGVVVRGINPDLAGSVTSIESAVGKTFVPESDGKSREELRSAGKKVLLSLNIRTASNKPPIIIGKELASLLRVSVGDIVSMLSPFGNIGPFGAMPKTRNFEVVGLFDFGMIEYDSSVCYINIRDAMDFFDLSEKANMIEIRTEDAFKTRYISNFISNELGFPYYTRSWEEVNKSLFKALKLERLALGVILGLIVLVAALNIVSTLIMLVMEKSKDIAILRAIGTTKEQIRRIFIIDGMIIGIIGTLAGTFAGYFLCYLLKTSEVIRDLIPFDNNIYPISEFPVRIDPLYFVLIAACSFLICLVATIYPSYQASSKDPVEILRYE